VTLPFRALKKTIDEVLAWYEFQAELLRQEKARVMKQILSASTPVNSRFLAMTGEEVQELLSRQHEELDFLVMLNLLAVAEAALQLDYKDKVGARRKDPVSRRFREIDKVLSKKKGPAERIHLERHILDTYFPSGDRTSAKISLPDP